mmetsp:Transcript_19320/g.55386  ORF Transcript_19320/g.55386 Transcript_19320/m.55386 type:complete len:212 (+) Transcript_19320:613-1248(+)
MVRLDLGAAVRAEADDRHFALRGLHLDGTHRRACGVGKVRGRIGRCVGRLLEDRLQVAVSEAAGGPRATLAGGRRDALGEEGGQLGVGVLLRLRASLVVRGARTTGGGLLRDLAVGRLRRLRRLAGEPAVWEQVVAPDIKLQEGIPHRDFVQIRCEVHGVLPARHFTHSRRARSNKHHKNTWRERTGGSREPPGNLCNAPGSGLRPETNVH